VRLSFSYLHTEEVLEQVDALGAVLARLCDARSDVALAAPSGPSGRAVAREEAHLVAAGSAVEARQ